MRRSSFLVLITALVGVALTPAVANARPGGPLRPVRACAELVGNYAIPDATTHVTDTAEVRAEGQPAYCRVTGFVEPAVRFQLRLPLDNFRGRYLQYGCGGFCGTVFDPAFPDCGPEAGDFAVAATDDGHVGHGMFDGVTDASWAADNQAARDDFAFRAPHVLSRAAKRIIAAFYGAPPLHSYFSGCSTGGREGLLLAQRYPTDFDGIVAGAPASIAGPLGVYQAWLARANTGADGAPVITAAKLPALHDAVLAACDRTDGLVDGQIDDPRACRFDPAAVRCAGADAADCLTPAQVEAARKIYAGPTDAHGVRLYPGWEPLGSELAWDVWIIPNPVFGAPESAAASIGDNFLRYLGFPIGAPASSLATFGFTLGEFFRLTPEGIKANAMNPDLSAFHRAGGKLILWHGWADQAIPPVGTIDYYARVVDANDGAARTRQFARLFLVPSLYHCSGGDRITEFDPVRALVGWVEHGAAPDRLVATGRDAANNVVRTRPVFPYPLVARYDGSGSVDDASNFQPARVAAPAPDKVRWAGEFLNRIPGPVAR
ncbi:MAG TPA: tannase/feruloyl esterase family alpha/beta hydrolase [Actinophytocola sp.]|uniref:tannase/feruloyl esterase family alpha/beta hydrolase n=1 Tax=Actinophytocola sp. TaxID=1872138 RepID=UPI002DFBD96B|nr:tannase/feruloyl esterase family alpha/beta hydrolase [Actinophytocola sp.]